LFKNGFRFINGNETDNTSLCGKSRYNPFHTVIDNDARHLPVNAKLGQTCPEIIDAGVDFFTGHPFVNAVFVIGAYESSVGEFGDDFVLLNQSGCRACLI
jgi:hypothetical protein